MRILLTGASGQLGAYLIDQILAENLEVIGWSRQQTVIHAGVEIRPVDLTDPVKLVRALDADDPEIIIHAAAISGAEAVRIDIQSAQLVNVEATRQIAAWCTRRARRLVFTSTDLVYDGSRSWNREEEVALPILAYGQTKRQAEVAVLGCETGLIARLPLLFGPSRCGRPYFFTRAMAAIARGEPQTFFEDEYRTPLDLATAARLLLMVARTSEVGLLHVAGAERVSRYELMRRATSALNLDASLIQPNRREDVTQAEPRPADVSLGTSRLLSMFPNLYRPLIEQAMTAS